LCICGEARVDAGAAKEVQSEKCLRKEAVPEVQWVIRIGAAEAGDEMIFEGPNRAFGSIAAMKMRGR
jgi:hypothetical protein